MRLLIADNNIQLCEILDGFFSQHHDIEVVGLAHNGEDTLSLADKLRPDVVLLDIAMPKLDGLGVLECLGQLALDPKPKCLIMTAFCNDDLVNRLSGQYGVDYLLLKPFSLDVLLKRLRQFAGIKESHPTYSTPSVPRDGHKEVLQQILHTMGIQPHLKGFTYLREAVLLYMKNGYLGGTLSKELYPALAEQFHTTSGGVEAGIRNAVQAGWTQGDPEYMRRICSLPDDPGQKMPTNSMLIARLAETVCNGIINVPVAE